MWGTNPPAICLMITLLTVLAQPIYSQEDLPDVSVTVVPQSRLHKNAIAHITKIGLGGLAGRSLKFEIENTGASEITGLTVSYEAFSCSGDNTHLWATSSSEPARSTTEPTNLREAHAATIPAHGRIVYDDDEGIASVIANWALHNKTRYVQARAEVVAVVLKDGTHIRWKEVEEPKQPPDTLAPSVCAMWPWNYKLDIVLGRAGWPPESGPSASQSTSDGAGVTYSCKVVDDLIHCPLR